MDTSIIWRRFPADPFAHAFVEGHRLAFCGLPPEEGGADCDDEEGFSCVSCGVRSYSYPEVLPPTVERARPQPEPEPDPAYNEPEDGEDPGFW